MITHLGRQEPLQPHRSSNVLEHSENVARQMGQDRTFLDRAGPDCKWCETRRRCELLSYDLGYDQPQPVSIPEIVCDFP
jgi:hypothetical protein